VRQPRKNCPGMKKKLFALFACICAAVVVSGCATSNPNVGPALFRLGVAQTAGYQIYRHPEARAGVKAAADIVCAVAAGTNVSPAAIVAALDATGNWNAQSWFIVTGALGTYEILYHGSDQNEAPRTMQPYAAALCGGLQDATLFPLPPVPGATKAMRRSAPVRDARWPQLK